MDNHLVRLVVEIVDPLDGYNLVGANISCGTEGHDPRKMQALFFLQLCHKGVFLVEKRRRSMNWC